MRPAERQYSPQRHERGTNPQPSHLGRGDHAVVGEVGYKHSGISTSSVGFAATFPKREGCGFVPLPLLCDRYCLSAGREAPPYDLYLFRCFAIGITFRRDAEDVVPYDLCLINTVMNVTLLGGTQGPALRVCAILNLLSTL